MDTRFGVRDSDAVSAPFNSETFPYNPSFFGFGRHTKRHFFTAVSRWRLVLPCTVKGKKCQDAYVQIRRWIGKGLKGAAASDPGQTPISIKGNPCGIGCLFDKAQQKLFFAVWKNLLLRSVYACAVSLFSAVEREMADGAAKCDPGRIASCLFRFSSGYSSDRIQDRVLPSVQAAHI